MLINEDKLMIDESLSSSIDQDISEQAASSEQQQNYFKKYIRLKKYLKRNENKFVQLEMQNIKAIKQIFDLLTNEQRRSLIRKLVCLAFFILKVFFNFFWESHSQANHRQAQVLVDE